MSCGLTLRVPAACGVTGGIGRRCLLQALGCRSSGVTQLWDGPVLAAYSQVLESVEQGYRQLHRDLSDRAAQYVETIGNEVLAYSLAYSSTLQQPSA